MFTPVSNFPALAGKKEGHVDTCQYVVTICQFLFMGKGGEQ